MVRLFRRRRDLLSVLVLLTILLGVFLTTLRVAGAVSPDPLLATWQRVQASGSYHFASTITQVTTPKQTILNVGRSSHEQHLYLEGETKLHERAAQMRLWTADGSVLQAESGLQVRIEDGHTLVRQGAEPWQEAESFTDAFAPQGNFLSYLLAVRDLVEHPPETRNGVTFTRFTFTIDGPTFAGYMRDQLMEAMHQRGELPPGAQFDVPSYYAEMTGTGELWMTSDGYPLRQILDLRFPEQKDEYVQAHISVDFSDFGPPVGWLVLPPADTLLLYLSTLLGLLLVLSFAGVLIVFRHSRTLATILAVGISLILVLNPFLTSVRIAGFLETQHTMAAEQEQERAEARQLRDTQTNSAQQFDPHRSPMEQAQQQTQAAAASTSNPTQSPPAFAPAAQPLASEDTGTDTDTDGLTDYIEAFIGTDPETADTDSDLITDTLEINGFFYNGQTWYSDPLNQDSNNDTIADGAEWQMDRDGDTLPDDTDGDGVPDLFDDDNDGDGVPDEHDLSPMFHSKLDAGSSYDQDNPFALVIEDLVPGEPVFVDFQIRPDNPEHLWYATRVYDWPSDDQGQIQDNDNQSFADVARAAGNTPDVTDEYGDMKLIPMLELTIMGNATNLPSQDELTNYNIFVNDITVNGQPGKVAYVPLTVVADSRTNERVAFNGRMFYRPGRTWGQAHQTRLVWAVQVLLDECDESESGQCVTYKTFNTSQVVQSYYDSWSLSGLTVREDHGTSWSSIYEDPSVDTDLNTDDALWLLANGLDQSFLAGRDENDNGERDLSVAEIARRFNHTTNNSVSLDERWNMPNILSVETASYEHHDLAMMTTAMTETKRILNNSFAPVWTQANRITPLILHAREETFRALTLDEITNDTGYATLDNGVLTLDFSPESSGAIPVDTLAGLQWGVYCATQTGNDLTWDECALDEYWEELASRYGSFIVEPGDVEDQSAGRLVLMQLYFLSIVRGLSSLVERDGVVQIRTSSVATDKLLRTNISAYRNVTRPAVEIIKEIIKAIDIEKSDSIKKVLIELGKAFKKRGQLFATPFSSNIRAELFKGLNSAVRISLIAVTVLIVAISITAIVAIALSGKSGGEIAFGIVGIVGGLYSFLGRVAKVKDAVEAVRKLITQGKTLLQALTASSSVIKVSAKAEIGAAIIGVLIAWGFFIAVVAVENIGAFSPTFNALLAQTIALTIYLIILTVLSLTVVGYFIVAILALIDLLFTAICELGVDELRDVPGLNGSCFTISGFLIMVIAKLIYSFDSMINVDRSDLVVMGELDLTVADQNKGYVDSNTFSVNLPITTTVVHKDPSWENWAHILPYIWLFSRDNIRSTTFKYEFTKGNSIDLKVERNQMNNNWTVNEDHKFAATPMYRAQNRSSHAPLVFQLSAGLNKSPDGYLNIGYALPAYECWTVPVPFPLSFPPVVPVCYVRTIDGFSSDTMSMLVFDIFPDTLDEFADLVDKGDGGLGLAWDATFPSLDDADGDGLISTAHRGIDPDDTTWDADSDDLADSIELSEREAGHSFSPFLWDTDTDGLTDKQELQLGTDPARRDSDNDGLEDGHEVYHEVYDFDATTQTVTSTGVYTGGWTMLLTETYGLDQVYTTTVRVTSDPNQADGDGDGWSDLAEYQLYHDQNLYYHPLIANQSPVVLVSTIDDPDGFVAPGQSLTYTTTVDIIPDAILQGIGVFEVNLPPVLNGSTHMQQIDLAEAQSRTIREDLSAQLNAPTQKVDLISLVRARLSDLKAAGWQWRDVVSEDPLGGFTRPAHLSALTEAQPDRQDRYMLTALTSDSAGSGGRGDIRAYGLIEGEARAIEYDAGPIFPYGGDDAYLRGDGYPTVACNDDGVCFGVWDHTSNCTTVYLGGLDFSETEDHGTGGVEPEIYITRSGTGSSEPDRSIAWGWYESVGNDTNVDAPPINVNRSLTFCGVATLEMTEVDNRPDIDTYGSYTINVMNPGSYTWSFSGEDPDGNDCGGFIGIGKRQCKMAGTQQLTINDHNIHGIAGALMNPDASERRSQFSLTGATTSSVADYQPTVTSDGENFLAVWERVEGGQQKIVARLFDSAGNLITDNQILQQNSSYVGALRITADWIGDRYRVLWNFSNTDIHMVDVGSNGVPLGSSTIIASNAADGRNAAAHLAYDPLNNLTLVVYRDTSGGIRGLLFTGSSTQPTALVFAPAGEQPRVAYHPVSRGWLVSWADPAGDGLVYEALQPDGSPLLTENSQRTFSWPTPSNGIAGLSLACPSPRSLPTQKLPFEEVTGATLFSDSSSFGNNAVCADETTCPLAGVSGTTMGPRSDFAISFDGQNDSATITRTIQDNFSIAFWMRSGQVSGGETTWTQGMGIVDGSTTGGNGGFGISLGNGKILFGAGTATLTSTSVANGNWHFVVATHKQNAAMRLFIDGAEVASTDGMTTTLDAPPVLHLGSLTDGTNFYRGALDELSFYATALSPDAIQGLYRDTQQSFCLASTTADGGIPFARLTLERPDTRGGLFSQESRIPVTIDADEPESVVQSLINGQYVRGESGRARTLVIGGKADDATSSVTGVAVSVNGSAFAPATGADSWTYNLQIREGEYSIQTRATDVVGNIETPVTTTTVLVDATPPVATFDPDPDQPLVPRRTESGDWLVALSGTISDPQIGTAAGSGVKPDSILVRLIAQEGAIAGNNEQPATLDGTTWTISYTFESNLPDPSGLYDVVLTARDNVDNRLENFRTSIQLDSRGPVVAMDFDDASTQFFSSNATISGVVSDTGSLAAGLASLEAAFVPIEQVEALSDTIALLPFDEPAGAMWFDDTTPQQHDARCETRATCPIAGTTGQLDGAITLDGIDDYVLIPDRDSIDFATNQDFTVALWVQAAATQPDTGNLDNAIVEKWNSPSGYPYVIRYINSGPDAGRIAAARYDGSANPSILSNVAINDGHFHHLAFVKHGSELTLYVDGQLSGTTVDTTVGDTTNDSPIFVGMRGPAPGINHFAGSVDELIIANRGLTSADVQALYAAGGVQWRNVTLAQTGSGVQVTTWETTIPDGLEGAYQLDIRGTDTLGNRGTTPYVWRGVIDTLSPTVALTAQPTGRSHFSFSTFSVRYEIQYSCEARDQHLDDATFVCPCNAQRPPDRFYQDAPWLQNVFPDTAQLVRLASSCHAWEDSPAPIASVAACDIFGHCAPDGSQPGPFQLTALADNAAMIASTPTALADNLALLADIPTALVVTPTQESIISSTTGSLSVVVAAAADSSLQDVALALDGNTVDTRNFAQGDAITRTQYTVALSSLSEGTHTLLPRASDWVGNLQTTPLPSTFTLDTQPPVITLDTAVLTRTSAYDEDGTRVRISGTATDTIGLSLVELSVDGSKFQDVIFDGTTWRTSWLLDSQLDNAPVRIMGRAIDRSGQIAEFNQDVNVDLAPPQPVTMTLAYRDGQGTIRPLAAGDTLHDTFEPSLVIQWTASSDGSGLDSYLVGWTTDAKPDLAQLTSTTSRRYEQVVQDGQVLYAHVVTRDLAGNRRIHTLGPVYVDYQDTPDILVPDLAYDGWLQSACTPIGADRRASLSALTQSPYRAVQRFYSTWDATGLRLAWTGADWTIAGNLFIYLDTRDGGSMVAYDPYGNARTIELPNARGRQMTADQLIWIEDNQTARLLSWDSSTNTWVVQTSLAADTFQFDASLPEPQTDIYLPFTLLGITAETPVGMLALASAEETLDLWAAMPGTNPLVAPDALAGNGDLKLTQQYFWSALAADVCPNDGHFTDADLRLAAGANPEGVTLGFLRDNLATRFDLSQFDATRDTQRVAEQRSLSLLSSLDATMDISTAPVDYAQVISYTFSYANEGTQAAQDVQLVVKAWGPVTLRTPQGDSTTNYVIDLGDIAAGVSGTVTIQGLVKQNPEPGDSDILGINAYVEDGINGLFDWQMVSHDLDSRPPTSVNITAPVGNILAGNVLVRGTALDPSGVYTITLTIRNLTTGTTREVICIDPTPLDGAWECEVNLSSAIPGERYELSATAADAIGLTSESAPRILTIIAPTATPTATPTRTSRPTSTRVPTATPTGTITATGTVTTTATRTPTGTLPTATHTATRTPTGTLPTATRTPTGTLSTPTTTTSPTVTVTITATGTVTTTATRTPTGTIRPSTPTPTINTTVSTATPTPTGTLPTSTATPTITGTVPTATPTPTPTIGSAGPPNAIYLPLVQR